MRSFFPFLGLALCLEPALAARPAPSQSMPLSMRPVFDTLVLPDAANIWRSGSGRPGPAYWQNRADYRIESRIDPDKAVLSGTETITYTNNSPDALDVLWLQLDQNMYRKDSRSWIAYPDWHPASSEGFVIERVALEEGGREHPVPFRIDDTRMQVSLPSPLAGSGHVLKLRVTWHHQIPGLWGGRTAVTPVKDGKIYEIAQWYPRMSVYDDLRGWDTLPYLGQEFYLEYGTIDYAVTVPWNFTVVGSGALVNPQDVLSATERARLAEAARSDKRVLIRTPGDVLDPASHLARSGEKTWRFHMENTRDVAFAASPVFVWDAARLDLPALPAAKGQKAQPRLAMSVYPREGAGPQAWDRSTEYVKHAIEYFSSQWYPYPWPNAVNLGGHGAGMEYPGIVFDGWQDKNDMLFWITTHELGHGWFPMIVGSNERRHAFMDEGFNTFIDAYASQHFNHGEYAPKKDAEFAPETGDPAKDIVPVLTASDAPSLMMPSELVPEKYRHKVTYFKGAYGLMLLREKILGPDRFDAAFRAYIRAWAFKHPTPSDFFRFMSSEAGEDLTWFWRGWYFENWWPQYRLDGMTRIAAKPETGHMKTSQTTPGQSATDAGNTIAIGVRNEGKLLLPVVLRVTWQDGTMAERIIPTEAWALHDRLSLSFPDHGAVKSVALDPDQGLPVPDRSALTLTPAEPARP
ncbi:peptidase M1 [Asaia sp. W19]|uniref:M1 family metallopeptidase n=1 Tax=unclassified Asaia TaxID=2685023 RepID=UPI000F8F196E|nr:peptidase M1 [Asaia sp. W19]